MRKNKLDETLIRLEIKVAEINTELKMHRAIILTILAMVVGLLVESLI